MRMSRIFDTSPYWVYSACPDRSSFTVNTRSVAEKSSRHLPGNSPLSPKCGASVCAGAGFSGVNISLATRCVRSASSEMRLSLQSRTQDSSRSPSTPVHFSGNAAAPNLAPSTDPAVAPLQSASQPPRTATTMPFS